MEKKDPRVNTYIGQAGDFAKPILTHLRAIVHRSCPEVEETMKWSMPFFVYKGMLCHMAAFKEHCSFGFWKGRLVLGEAAAQEGKDGMGHFGKIGSLKDLPSDRLIARYVKKAMTLNDAGVKKERPTRSAAKKPPTVPDYFRAALAAQPDAAKAFAAFSATHQREYVEWLTEAKQDSTRARRLQAAVEMITAGKSRHWKYQRGNSLGIE